MNTDKINEVKDEVARKYYHPNWRTMVSIIIMGFKESGETWDDRYNQLMKLENEAILLYAQRQSADSETVLKKLNEALLPENLECDGAGCMGCWKDKVREAINLIKANNFLIGSADSGRPDTRTY